ncbi:MAG: xanthine dehydrogenase family protein subunit M [Mesorhizobium sp.]|uniref:FAD binding domain-containing protein n=1 Tax=Mesorhizobium sp. TaxID=1871066 RepID=UPI000FE77F87|nr:xanthine dehydrogenase family protein subunit M [Mesorhizobium sp.]RWI50289.1 MAG: xanthine dehydrogenase family protein subunit M [Mesorhizobium sp.]
MALRPISYTRANTPAEAVQMGAVSTPGEAAARVQFLGGGTQLLDLAKLDVIRPERLVDITRITDPVMTGIRRDANGLRLGALVTMREAAEHPDVMRDYPVMSESLWMGASQQIRNMGRLGGNVLQRTRCSYYRDTQWRCNKREPGSGCDALEGHNRWHAVLGTSETCIASYPGDWAVSLVALGATVDVLGQDGPRTMPFSDLHRDPGETPHLETNLRPGELITSFFVPAGPWTRRSLYVKVRDRASYEFGLATVACALDLDGEIVRAARLGLGGPVTRPWRLTGVEAALVGLPLNEANAAAAAELAFVGALPREHNAFRIPLAKATIVRALMAAKEIRP